MVTLATLYNDFKTLISQNFYPKEDVDDLLDTKQDTLVSGTSIKTLNGNSLLGSGNISISGSGTVDSALSTTSTNPVQNKVINTALTNKVDKTDGANQMTDSNAYANLGTSSNATQKTINNAIDTEISSINNSITNKVDTIYSTTATCNSNLAFTSTTTVNYRRVGNIVIADLWNNTCKPTVTGWRNFVGIPSGYRPVADLYLNSTTGATQIQQVSTTSNGTAIRAYVSSAPSSNIYFGFMGVWVTNDDYPV